jgi:glucose/arabinose dehydrogenase/mono/diheme cytochrome c family protein
MNTLGIFKPRMDANKREFPKQRHKQNSAPFVSIGVHSRFSLFALWIAGFMSALAGSPAPSVPYLSPEQEQATFRLPPGYHMELVIADPVIKEPVAVAFDGNGRMFVAEMRAFMQDLDGTNERAKNGRISLHWSSKGDGVYDRHSVFIDGLVLPRMILPLDDGLLVGETDSDDLYIYRDTDGNGVAGKKELWYAGGPRGGNLEHQPSGLVWCLDNWIYTSYNAYRLRWNGAGRPPLKESTPPNGGQWGLSQDDYGKPWFIGGAERGPLNFQVPILYGAFNVDGQAAPEFSEVWPLVGLADVEGGPMRFRPEDKTLNHFTSACGMDIVRGDRLPADLRGDLLLCEPVGRLVRRAKVEVDDGLTHLRNAEEKSEFLRSTDPNFRPVNVCTAPDGTVYVVDMYRGVVQEAVAIREGSYLRKVVKELGLERNTGRGRIWRLVHDGARPGPLPHMLDETPEKLVAHLEHPNGWWRDTAQKLLILRGDASRAAVPALQEMARGDSNPLARLHALWTLDGLGALDAVLLREKLADAHPQVRIGALRASERLLQQGDSSLRSAVWKLINDPEPLVVIQTMMTVKSFDWPAMKETAESFEKIHPSRGVRELSRQLLQPASPFLTDDSFTAAQKSFLSLGEVGYRSLCFACHGIDGTGTPVENGPPGATLAPPLAGANVILGPPQQSALVLLHGLTGPVDGRTYPTQMIPMATNSDNWIAAVLSYVRISFGNHAPLVKTEDVTRIRAATRDWTQPPTLEQVLAFPSAKPEKR